MLNVSHMGSVAHLVDILPEQDSCAHVLDRAGRVSFYLQSVPPLLGEGAQVVPLVTDALAAGVDCGGIVVVQLTDGDKKTQH